MPKVVAIVAFLAAGVLFALPWFHSRDFECAECSTTADCGNGLTCEPFDDGQSRCVDREMTCAQGHLTVGGTWTHMAMVAALAVGALALSWRRLAQSVRAQQ